MTRNWKRTADVLASGAALVLLSPVLGGFAAAVWAYDRGSPLYRAKRVGRAGATFTMFKFRTMVFNADQIGGSSTGSNDPRITPVGRVLRASKVDEFPQLWNVLRGDMSLVGPRPNIDWEVATYSQEEMALLDVRPGITDLSSIVFADEGDILCGQEDPDLAYEQLIRPWKSRLSLTYVRNASPSLDFRIVLLTLLNSINRPAALLRVSRLLGQLGAHPSLSAIALRDQPLAPTAPPGHSNVIARVAS